MEHGNKDMNVEVPEVVSPTFSGGGLSRQGSVTKHSCLCSPTTHAGSFRCRLHRAPSFNRTKSVNNTQKIKSKKRKKDDVKHHNTNCIMQNKECFEIRFGSLDTLVHIRATNGAHEHDKMKQRITTKEQEDTNKKGALHQSQEIISWCTTESQDRHEVWKDPLVTPQIT